jgi:hypothetical protein
MRRILSVAFFAFAAAAFTWAQSAQDIMAKVRDRSGVTSTQARVAMKLTDKAGSVSDRLLDQYSVGKAGTAKSVIVFQKPANVKDTRFLSVENASGPEDRWIWLPAAGKIRRIASSEGGTSFMGTDLSYDDLSAASRSVDADTFVPLGTETLGGETVYVIEATPKDLAGSTYSKAVYRVLAEKWLALKIEQYDKKGSLVKINETLAYDKVDGFWTPTKFKVSNVQTGHSTELTMEILKFNKEIPAGVFTTRFLETGRP